MALRLSTVVAALPGIGEAAASDLKNLDVISLRDLLLYFPYRYDDFSVCKPISKVKAGEPVTVTGKIRSIQTRPSKGNRHLMLTEAIVEDESGSLKVMWFNQPYLEKTLKVGTEVSLAGIVDAKFGFTLANPVHEPGGVRIHTGRIVPVYGRSGSLTIRRLRSAMHTALKCADQFGEWVPEEVIAEENLPAFAKALQSIHFPESQAELDAGINRLKFDELFLRQMMFERVRRDRAKREADAVAIDEAFLKQFVAGLPFTLTPGQKKAAWEIIQDMARGEPMNRLLQGDVGSGKTVVAAIAAAHIVHRGKAVAYLAPTEILAGQQQNAFAKFLPEPVALLTGKESRIGGEVVLRPVLFEAIAEGKIKCVVGTHA